MGKSRLGLFLTLAGAAVAGAACDTRPEERIMLGPHDGLDLPAVDTGRVKVGDVAPDFSAVSYDGSVITLDDRHGPVAGAIEGITFGSSELTLEPGDVAILYTDGVTEAMNIEQEQFGKARLVQLLEELTDLNPQPLVKHIRRAVSSFVEGARQSDDITMLAVRVG